MKQLYLSFLITFFISSCLTAQNTAIQLDGNTDHLVVSYKDQQNIGTAFTIEAWIYAESWANESWRGSIVCNDNQGPDRGYAFRCGDNGKLSMVISVDNTWEEVLSPALMNVKQWHHVATTVNGTMVTLYVDGQAVASGSFDGTPSDLDTDLLIGSSNFDGRFFNGAIDEVRIWNVARTAQEIADNTTTDFAGTEDGLAYYFPMNEGSGNIANNLVDQNCSATGIGVDDGNWIDGYSLPEFDLTLRAITGIDLINVKNRPQKIKALVQNVGRETISDFAISITVDSEEHYTETFAESIAAGDLVELSLSTPIDLSQLTTPEINAVISHPDDANSLNNDYTFGFINSQDNRVNLYSAEQHNFGAAGQNQERSITLPADFGEYAQILLHLSLTCPSGGCDPWDQPAAIYAFHEGRTIEIARYITPYGIACGDWTVDVTDFKNVFTGQTNLNSYIQVWGPNGWLLDADLEFVPGASANPHTIFTPLWTDDYVVYGDPAISHDLEEKSEMIHFNTNTAHIRMHITGHGQGNTFNAAEFYDVTHSLKINGNELYQDRLWKDDCASNACADQAGNWLFPRAGWCPGQEVQPRIFDVTNEINTVMNIDYELADYTNLLNTGYNSSGHTEPHYRIHGSLIEKSDIRYSEYHNLYVDIEKAEAISASNVAITFNILNNGNVEKNVGEARVYLNYEEIITIPVNVNLAPGEVYPIDYPASMDLVEGINLIFVEIVTEDDENPGDDVDRFELDFSVSNENVSLQNKFSISPNPSPSTININIEEDLMSGKVELLSTTGILLASKTIDQLSETLLVENQGTYLIKVTDLKGNIGIKKVIVIE